MKNKIKLLLGASLLLVITSCGGDPVSSSINSIPTPGTTSQTTSTGPAIEYKTNEDFELARTTYVDENGETKNLYRQTLYDNQNSPHLDSLEEQRVLVVPFGFTDSDLQEKVQTKENIERIKTVFFGTREQVKEKGGWYSVQDFYNTSSFGKSKFEGDVVNNWCIYNGTSSQFSSNSSTLGIDAGTYVRSWYLTEYAKADHGLLGAEAKPLTYYDQDDDGYIDLLWMVYSHPYSTDQSQTWWAYVTYTNNGPSENLNAPNVMTLGWASINFMNDAFNGYDAHTFIHETGHTYGLDDYYDYNDSWSPMGAIDMMDNNIGDHCAFSKFSLGWLSPLVVDDSAIITLRPTTTTGDCFIIPSQDYNGTVFDEYMMVEFMSPVGLAEVDYKQGYKYISGYSEPGIRISHIDARAVSALSASAENYLTTNPEDGVDIRIANSKGGRNGPQEANFFPVEKNGKIEYNSYALTMMFESNPDVDSNITTSKGNSASKDSLFGTFSSFDLEGEDNVWANIYMPSRSNLWNKAKTMTGGSVDKDQKYTINEEYTFDYKIEVLSVNKETAKVRVTKINRD